MYVKRSLSQFSGFQRFLLKMFYIIGLGLSDEKDITVRGLEVIHIVSM